MTLLGPQQLAFLWGVEATYGTAVARTEAVPALSENVSVMAERLVDEAIYAGARVPKFEQVARGNVTAKGEVTTPLYDRGLRALLKQWFGTESGAASPFTYSVGDLSGQSLTVEVVKSGVDATEAWVLDGVKITEAELSMEAGKLAEAKWGFVGQGYALGGAATTPSYPAGLVPHKATGMTLSMTGGASFNLKQLRVRMDNKLAVDRFFASAAEIAEPLEAGVREITAEATIEYPDVTHVNQQLAGTEVALAATLIAGSNSFAINLNGDVEDASVSVSQRTGLVEQTLKIVGSAQSGGGAESTALNIVYTTV